jgi:hypothetical protein
MFVVFHVDAFFLHGEVLLYFSVRVEVIEIINLIRIQIGLEFRKDLKNKKPFSFFLLAMDWNSLTGPAWLWFSPLCAARVAAQKIPPCVAWQGTDQPSGAQLAQRRRPEDGSPTEFILNSYHVGSLPLRIKPNQCGNEFDWRIKTTSWSNPL